MPWPPFSEAGGWLDVCLYPRAVTRYQERQQFWWLQPVVLLWDLRTTLCAGFAPGESVLSRWDEALGPSPQVPRGPCCPHGIKTLVSVAHWERPFGRTVNVCDVQNTGRAVSTGCSLGSGPRQEMRVKDDLAEARTEVEASGLSFPGHDGRQEPDAGAWTS